MVLNAGMVLNLLCLSLFAGIGCGFTNEAHLSSQAVIPLGEVCSFSPLLSTQSLQYGAWQGQCSSKPAQNTTSPRAAANETSTTKPTTDDESSGGWTGPHACAGIYCVYANRDFAAGRGIIIISDGDTANALANLAIFVQLAGPRSAELLETANINVQARGVETRDIPGKGRGLVAARDIYRGEQILAYTPALVLRRSLVDDLGRADQLRLLREAVGRLPPATRVAFWQQLGQTHQEGDDDILDIVMNNSFNLPLDAPSTDDGVAFVGNFPEVSMYNHDCRPSVAFHLDHGLVHRTLAARGAAAGAAAAGIRPGEELSISYVSSFRARDVRRARTRRNWGFECACAQCMLPEALANASDHRLWRIYEVESALALEREHARPAVGGMMNKGKSRAADNKKGPAAPAPGDLDAVELLLSLYAQERLLESHGASAYNVAALNYSAFRRRELAIKYALLALEAYIVENGARSEGAADMVALLDEPERHWSWGRKSA